LSVIYKENRIVVDYDYEDLVLLAIIDNKDGYELKIHDPKIHLEGIRLIHLYQNLGFKVVKKYDGIKDFKELKNKIALLIAIKDTLSTKQRVLLISYFEKKYPKDDRTIKLLKNSMKLKVMLE
jgi:hypothetical protein